MGAIMRLNKRYNSENSKDNNLHNVLTLIHLKSSFIIEYHLFKIKSSIGTKVKFKLNYFCAKGVFQMQKQRKNGEQIDLIELLYELLNHWKMILLCAVLAGVIEYAYSKYMVTPLYQSTAKLYLVSNNISIASLADLNLGTSLSDDYLEVINSRPVLDQVIKNLDLKTSYGGLKGRISLSASSSSRILSITVTYTNPQTAKTIADEVAVVASAYIAEKMYQDPPSIIQYGYSDGGVVNNAVNSNTRKGALIGAALAAAVIILLYLLNDTIMDPDEVERKLGMNLLGTLPIEKGEKESQKKRKRE
jgi:capsular polysaccharide biosynthesis protein